MEKKIKLYIHLGFPKTASTLLQNYYFSSISEIKYLNNNNSNLKKLIQRMLFYKLDKYKNQKKRINRIVNNISFSSDKVNIISDESFTDLSTNDEINPLNRIEKFKLTFPKKKFDIKFIIVTRNQIDLLLSHYAYCYNNFLLRNLIWTTFEKFILSIKEKKYENYLKFYNFNYWKKSMIKQKVDYRFFMYEVLNKNPNNFYRDLSFYLNIKYKTLNTKKINVSIRKNKSNIVINKKINILNLVFKLTDFNLYFNLKSKKFNTLLKRTLLLFKNKSNIAHHNKKTIKIIKKLYLKENILFLNSNKRFKKFSNFYKFSGHSRA